MIKTPKSINLSARTSSITNAFINGIIPNIVPSENEVIEVLSIFKMSLSSITCVYCGDNYTEWDHLRPLVSNKMPTGYITEIKNLVPSCGKCNQSKGNKNWKEWMLSSAQHSPKSRGIKDLQERIEMLELFEKWGNVNPIDLSTLVDKELWNKHWDNYYRLIELMKESQKDLLMVKKQIENSYKNNIK